MERYIEEARAVHPPGYYKINTRALSIREMIRMSGLLRLPLTFIISRCSKPSWPGWMPGLSADLKCSEQELSDRFWKATEASRLEMQRLGFAVFGASKVRRQLDPRHRDNGGLSYLHADRSQIAQILYVVVHSPAPIPNDVERVTIVFTAAFGDGGFSCTNGKQTFDPARGQEVVRLSSDSPTFLYERFQTHLKTCGEKPTRFGDNDSVWRWFDSVQQRSFDERVDRGLFVKMTDREVEEALTKAPPPLP